MRRLHVYSNPTIDLIEAPNLRQERAGGPALYAALAGKILGFETFVYGAVGVDGHSVVKEYMARGVRFGKLVYMVDEKTTRFRLVYREDGSRVVEVVELGPRVSHMPLSKPRLVSPVLNEFAKPLVWRLIENAYVDIQGFVRSRLLGVVRYEKGVCNEMFDKVKPRCIHGDVVELQYCFNAKGLDLASKLYSLAAEGTTVIASMGYQGLLFFTPKERRVNVYHVKAWGPKTNDPTGMGDVLTASYAVSDEEDPLDAIRVAVVVCGYHAKREYDVDVDDVLRHTKEVEARDVSIEEAAKMLAG